MKLEKESSIRNEVLRRPAVPSFVPVLEDFGTVEFKGVFQDLPLVGLAYFMEHDPCEAGHLFRLLPHNRGVQVEGSFGREMDVERDFLLWGQEFFEIKTSAGAA